MAAAAPVLAGENHMATGRKRSSFVLIVKVGRVRPAAVLPRVISLSFKVISINVPSRPQ